MPRKVSEKKRTPPTKKGKNTVVVKKEKRKRKKPETFSHFIYKVLKQVHPEMGISARGMSVIHSFVTDIFERIASEAGRLCKYTKKRTMMSRDIQTAVRLTIPGELARHSVSEGTKAVTKFMNSNR